MLRTTVLSGVVPLQLSCCPWGSLAPVKSSCRATEPSEDDKPTGQKNIFCSSPQNPWTWPLLNTVPSSQRQGLGDKLYLSHLPLTLPLKAHLCHDTVNSALGLISCIGVWHSTRVPGLSPTLQATLSSNVNQGASWVSWQWLLAEVNQERSWSSVSLVAIPGPLQHFIWPAAVLCQFPSRRLCQAHFCLTSLTGIPFPGKKLKVVYSREEASNVQVELVWISVEDDAYWVWSSVDQEASRLLPAQTSVAFSISWWEQY